MGKFKKSIRFDSAVFVIQITDSVENTYFFVLSYAHRMLAEIQLVYHKKLENCSKFDLMHVN